MTIWIPPENPDHEVHVETQTVVRGRKTYKQLKQENIENPNREWVDDKGADFDNTRLKEIANIAKARYQLTDVTIKEIRSD